VVQAHLALFEAAPCGECLCPLLFCSSQDGMKCQAINNICLFAVCSCSRCSLTPPQQTPSWLLLLLPLLVALLVAGHPPKPTSHRLQQRLPLLQQQQQELQQSSLSLNPAPC
jgi:hypothetical protein